MLQAVSEIARQAGQRILEHYHDEVKVDLKADESPLTIADRASHQHICKCLAEQFPDIPIVSEEGELPEYEVRAKYARYWLIDPLDGTKEFIKKNGEFTVNIALIEANRPVLGVVDVPVKQQTYSAEKGKGAFIQRGEEKPERIQVRQASLEGLKLAGSRSHPSPEMEKVLAALPGSEIVSLGSSLKFCLLAEGDIDLYPRFGPTMEWDTAAAQVVVEESGGLVVGLDGGPFLYNKPVLKNPGFLVASSQALVDKVVAAI